MSFFTDFNTEGPISVCSVVTNAGNRWCKLTTKKATVANYGNESFSWCTRHLCFAPNFSALVTHSSTQQLATVQCTTAKVSPRTDKRLSMSCQPGCHSNNNIYYLRNERKPLFLTSSDSVCLNTLGHKYIHRHSDYRKLEL